MDFVVENDIFNFINPPPEKLPAMEAAVDDRFSIPQLRSLVKELRLLANSSGKISNRNAIELLVRKSNNSQALRDQGGLPKTWMSLGQAGFEKMIRSLDYQQTGSIDFKLFALCCILQHSPLPIKPHVSYIASAELEYSTEVTLEKFLSL